MNKKILALLVSALIIFNVSFAGPADNGINKTVVQSFTNQFEQASDINWTKEAGYYKASFTWNNQHLNAFYGNNGEPIAVSRNITADELPLGLQTDLAAEYKSYWIAELFEYTTENNNKYYLTIENADRQIILESMDNSYWTVYKKTSKN